MLKKYGQTLLQFMQILHYFITNDKIVKYIMKLEATLRAIYVHNFNWHNIGMTCITIETSFTSSPCRKNNKLYIGTHYKHHINTNYGVAYHIVQ